MFKINWDIVSGVQLENMKVPVLKTFLSQKGAKGLSNKKKSDLVAMAKTFLA